MITHNPNFSSLKYFFLWFIHPEVNTKVTHNLTYALTFTYYLYRGRFQRFFKLVQQSSTILYMYVPLKELHRLLASFPGTDCCATRHAQMTSISTFVAIFLDAQQYLRWMFIAVSFPRFNLKQFDLTYPDLSPGHIMQKDHNVPTPPHCKSSLPPEEPPFALCAYFSPSPPLLRPVASLSAPHLCLPSHLQRPQKRLPAPYVSKSQTHQFVVSIYLPPVAPLLLLPDRAACVLPVLSIFISERTGAAPLTDLRGTEATRLRGGVSVCMCVWGTRGGFSPTSCLHAQSRLHTHTDISHIHTQHVPHCHSRLCLFSQCFRSRHGHICHPSKHELISLIIDSDFSSLIQHNIYSCSLVIPVTRLVSYHLFIYYLI